MRTRSTFPGGLGTQRAVSSPSTHASIITSGALLKLECPERVKERQSRLGGFGASVRFRGRSGRVLVAGAPISACYQAGRRRSSTCSSLGLALALLAAPGKHRRLGPEPVSGSAFRAAISDWQRPEERFAGAGPMVRIRFPPTASLLRADSAAGSKGRSTQSRRDVGTSDKGQDKAQRHHSERAANEAI